MMYNVITHSNILQLHVNYMSIVQMKHICRTASKYGQLQGITWLCTCHTSSLPEAVCIIHKQLTTSCTIEQVYQRKHKECDLIIIKCWNSRYRICSKRIKKLISNFLVQRTDALASPLTHSTTSEPSKTTVSPSKESVQACSPWVSSCCMTILITMWPALSRKHYASWARVCWAKFSTTWTCQH